MNPLIRKIKVGLLKWSWSKSKNVLDETFGRTHKESATKKIWHPSHLSNDDEDVHEDMPPFKNFTLHLLFHETHDFDIKAFAVFVRTNPCLEEKNS